MLSVGDRGVEEQGQNPKKCKQRMKGKVRQERMTFLWGEGQGAMREAGGGFHSNMSHILKC